VYEVGSSTPRSAFTPLSPHRVTTSRDHASAERCRLACGRLLRRLKAAVQRGLSDTPLLPCPRLPRLIREWSCLRRPTQLWCQSTRDALRATHFQKAFCLACRGARVPNAIPRRTWLARGSAR